MMFLVGAVIGGDFRDRPVAVPDFALDPPAYEQACLLNRVLVDAASTVSVRVKRFTPSRKYNLYATTTPFPPEV